MSDVYKSNVKYSMNQVDKVAESHHGLTKCTQYNKNRGRGKGPVLNC